MEKENGNDSNTIKTVSNDDMISQDESDKCNKPDETISTVDMIDMDAHENNRESVQDGNVSENLLENKSNVSTSDILNSQDKDVLLQRVDVEANNKVDTLKLGLVSSVINQVPVETVAINQVNENVEDINKSPSSNYSETQEVVIVISPQSYNDNEINEDTALVNDKEHLSEETVDKYVSNQNSQDIKSVIAENSNCNQDTNNATDLNISDANILIMESVTSEINTTEKDSIDTRTRNNNLKRSIETDDEISSTDVIPLKVIKNSKVELYANDTGPKIYDLKGNIVTPPIISKNLPKMFQDLPIFGRPESKSKLNEFYDSKIREFVGCDLDDDAFEELERYCSPENLKLGTEMVMHTNYPTNNVLHEVIEHQDGQNLCTVKKHKLRVEKDVKGIFIKKLKYRSMRVLPFPQEDHEDGSSTSTETETPDEQLEPGKDILYIVRVYRPYFFHTNKERLTRCRHSVICYNVILTGRQKLTALRDRFVCHNDFDMRVDVSNNPDVLPKTKAKDVFPSGFLFINNVFYVDTREGCVDYSDTIREWAVKKGIGEFEKRDMCQMRMDDLVLKLGHPDVYMHQGDCEHIFVFSEIRLLKPSDPSRLSLYPCSTAVGQNQTVYCTTCAEFCAKWIVTGCPKVPFDPTFFCDNCFRQYLYKKGQKVCDFKAYSYRGNALNILKPQ